MKEGRKPEHQGKTPDDKLQKMPQTKARKFKPPPPPPPPHRDSNPHQAWKADVLTITPCVLLLLYKHQILLPNCTRYCHAHTSHIDAATVMHTRHILMQLLSCTHVTYWCSYCHAHTSHIDTATVMHTRHILMQLLSCTSHIDAATVMHTRHILM